MHDLMMILDAMKLTSPHTTNTSSKTKDSMVVGAYPTLCPPPPLLSSTAGSIPLTRYQSL